MAATLPTIPPSLRKLWDVAPESNLHDARWFAERSRADARCMTATIVVPILIIGAVVLAVVA